MEREGENRPEEIEYGLGLTPPTSKALPYCTACKGRGVLDITPDRSLRVNCGCRYRLKDVDKKQFLQNLHLIGGISPLYDMQIYRVDDIFLHSDEELHKRLGDRLYKDLLGQLKFHGFVDSDSETITRKKNA